MRTRNSLILHGVLFGLGGLLLTMPVWFFIGKLLFGDRPNWATGTGDGFVAMLTGLYATPFSALTWAGVGVLLGFLRRRPRTPRWVPSLSFAAALLLWLALGFAAQLIMG